MKLFTLQVIVLNSKERSDLDSGSRRAACVTAYVCPRGVFSPWVWGGGHEPGALSRPSRGARGLQGRHNSLGFRRCSL